jgi:hypothetical protein
MKLQHPERLSVKSLSKKPETKQTCVSNRHPEFTTGDRVPRSGNYRIFHVHRLKEFVSLLKDNTFPACPSCDVPVGFGLLSPVPIESASARFRLLMEQKNEAHG